MIISVSMVHKYIRRDLRHRSNSTYSTRASYYANGRLHLVLMDLGRDLDNTLGDNMVGLIVGGTYGRGDGQFLPTPGKYGTGVWSVGQAPKDDIELFLITQERSKVSRRRVSHVFAKYTQILGVKLRLVRVVAQRDIGLLPLRKEWYEMSRFHVVVFGPASIMDPLKSSFGRRTNARGFPLFAKGEAQRLLGKTGILGYEANQNPSLQKITRLAFLESLTEVLCINAGVWEADASARLLAAQSLIKGESWFLRNPVQAETLRSALSTMGPEAHQVDLRAEVHDYPKLWLIVRDYLSESEAHKSFSRLDLASGLLWILMKRSSHSTSKPGFFFRACFVFLRRFRPILFS